MQNNNAGKTATFKVQHDLQAKPFILAAMPELDPWGLSSNQWAQVLQTLPKGHVCPKYLAWLQNNCPDCPEYNFYSYGAGIPEGLTPEGLS